MESDWSSRSVILGFDDGVFGGVALQSVPGVGELHSIRVRRCAPGSGGGEGGTKISALRCDRVDALGRGPYRRCCGRIPSGWKARGAWNKPIDQESLRGLTPSGLSPENGDTHKAGYHAGPMQRLNRDGPE